MHWFWRGAIVCIVTALIIFGLVMTQAITLAAMLIAGALYWLPLGTNDIAAWLIVAAMLSAVPLFLYGLWGRYLAPDPSNETRCRKCGYILRGITELRCPECGERI